MKIRILLLSVIFFAMNIYSQVTFQAGVGLGYTIPTGDMTGNTTDFYNGNKYGLSNGINLHAKARIGIISFNVFGEADYSTFSNTGESEPGQGEVEVSQKILSLKAGPEFSLGLPLIPITPYANLFISVNTISGEVKFQGVSGVPSGTKDIKSATRYGFGAGAGVVFDVSENISLDLNLQYNNANAFGKEFNLGDPTSHERLDNYTSLNDDKDPLYGLNNDRIISKSRSLSSFEVKATVMFGI
jgi:opacity protein-like surface antigen